MASYTVARSKHATLVAATVDSVTFSSDYKNVEILNRAATGDIYATVDGTTPVVGADDTIIVSPGQFVSIEMAYRSDSSADVVKLISAGTPAYSVTAG
jgi:hypothetical protein